MQSLDDTNRGLVLNPVQAPSHSRSPVGLESKAIHVGRRLPATPTEEPYSYARPTDVGRAHSRAESEPNPLPAPFKPKLAPRTQLARLTVHHPAQTTPTMGLMSSSVGPSPPSVVPSPPPMGPSPPSMGPTLSPMSHSSPPPTPISATSPTSPLPSLPKVTLEPIEEKEGKQFRVRPRSMSLNSQPARSTGVSLFGGTRWKGRAQVAPLRQELEGAAFNIGWSAQFGGKQIPGDIKAMMTSPPPISAYNSIQNLYTSTDPTHLVSMQETHTDRARLSHALPVAAYLEANTAEVASPRRKSLSAKSGERANTLHALRVMAPEVTSVKDLADNIPGEVRDEQKSHQVSSMTNVILLA